ncbi:MAG: PRC-barrel domain-containing protein [Thermomicrobiales bacterium]
MGDEIAKGKIPANAPHLYQLENLPVYSAVEALRWKVMIGTDGERIGTIESLERDEDTDIVEFLQVGRGGFLGFGAERFLVPVTAIVRVDEKNVYIDRPLHVVAGAPEYDYERINDPDYCAGVRAWWCMPVEIDVSRTESGTSTGTI